MKLAEQHIIHEAAFKSKNLYHAALYLVRQSYWTRSYFASTAGSVSA